MMLILAMQGCHNQGKISGKFWQKYVHEVLVNRLGGLSLPRKSVVWLTDHPDMTLDVYCGRKTTMQHIWKMKFFPGQGILWMSREI